MSVSTSSLSITSNKNNTNNNTDKTAIKKPFLPSLATLLNSTENVNTESEKSKNDSSFGSNPALVDSLQKSFHNDNEGFIRLPPISINRPKLVESCLRHTASLPNITNTGANNSRLPTPTEMFNIKTNAKNDTLAAISTPNTTATSLPASIPSYTTTFPLPTLSSSNNNNNSSSGHSSNSSFSNASYDKYPITPINNNKFKLLNNKENLNERTLNIGGAKIRSLITPTPLSKSTSNISDSLSINSADNNNSNNITLTNSNELVSHTPTPIVQQSVPINENNEDNNDTRNNNSMSTSKKFDVTTPLNAVKSILTPSTNEKKRAFAFITHSKDTFGVKEPKIDNAPLARRKRRRTSAQELNILQLSFEKNATPDKATRIELADRCHMSEKAVQIWFQNKRQATKRQKLALENKEKNNISTSNKINNNNNISMDNISIVDVDEVEDSILMNENRSIINNDQHSTPVKNRTNSDSATPNSNNKSGQALTFHVRNDKKILTPVKISPNNKVNKLINNFGTAKSISNKSSPIKKQKLQFKSNNNGNVINKLQNKTPLKELNSNIFK